MSTTIGDLKRWPRLYEEACRLAEEHHGKKTKTEIDDIKIFEGFRWRTSMTTEDDPGKFWSYVHDGVFEEAKKIRTDLFEEYKIVKLEDFKEGSYYKCLKSDRFGSGSQGVTYLLRTILGLDGAFISGSETIYTCLKSAEFILVDGPHEPPKPASESDSGDSLARNSKPLAEDLTRNDGILGPTEKAEQEIQAWRERRFEPIADGSKSNWLGWQELDES